jgi:hypothetical protein
MRDTKNAKQTQFSKAKMNLNSYPAKDYEYEPPTYSDKTNPISGAVFRLRTPNYELRTFPPPLVAAIAGHRRTTGFWLFLVVFCEILLQKAPKSSINHVSLERLCGILLKNVPKTSRNHVCFVLPHGVQVRPAFEPETAG